MVTTCHHPATRLYTWRAFDDSLCIACCDCGHVLKGAPTMETIDQIINDKDPATVFLARLGIACNGKLPGSPEIAAYIAARECIERYHPLASLILAEAASLERRHYMDPSTLNPSSN